MSCSPVLPGGRPGTARRLFGLGLLITVIAISCSPVSRATSVQGDTFENDGASGAVPYTESGIPLGFSDDVQLQFHFHEPSIWQSLSLGLMSLFAGLWVFILGSCIGSFLNVVIYRMPAGLKLGKPKSRCPGCSTPLAARDNVPVLGWLFLKGRCRYCGMRISPRYPIIETTVGIIFLGLLLIEVMSGGRNLAVRPPSLLSGPALEQVLIFGHWNLLGLYLFHCCWLTLLLATIMIGYDGHRPPRRLLGFGIAVALIAGTVWPELRPVAALEPGYGWFAKTQWGFRWQLPESVSREVLTTGVSAGGLVTGLAGLLGGGICAALIWYTGREESPDRGRRDARADSMLLTGVFLGWQAAGMLLVLYLPIVVVADRVGSRQLGRQSLLALFPVATAFLLSWRWLDESVWMIGHDGWSFTAATWPIDWMLTVAALAAITVAARPRSLTAGS